MIYRREGGELNIKEGLRLSEAAGCREAFEKLTALHEAKEEMGTSRNPGDLYLEMTAILASVLPGRDVEGLRNALEQSGHYPNLAERYLRSMRAYEAITASRIIDRPDISDFLLRPGIPDLLPSNIQEFYNLRNQNPSQVVYLGCGAVPFAAITYAALLRATEKGWLDSIRQALCQEDLSGRNAARSLLARAMTESPSPQSLIRCYDIDEEMVSKAEEIVSRLGLDSMLKIELCDLEGPKIDSPRTAVVMAAAVEPKAALVKRCLDRENVVSIVCRTMLQHHPYSLFVPPLSEQMVAEAALREDLRIIRWSNDQLGVGCISFLKDT